MVVTERLFSNPCEAASVGFGFFADESIGMNDLLILTMILPLAKQET